MADNTCMLCGRIIPEGRHICLSCEGQSEMQTFWKNAPAVDRWISVEDALPEKDKSYITYSETTKYCNHNEISEDSRVNVLYFDGEEWYDGECRYYNVLHWMPLPDPPKKEVSDEKK